MSGEAAWPVALLGWFHAHKREMPWRSQRSPYRVWVSEIMLQQTQVATVTPYFQRFVGRFPSVRALAEADQQEVLKAWEGLGYYSRARNLQAGARMIVQKLSGRFPTSASEWQAVPGVGPYTAAAIASICYGEPVPVVDGNVLRVMARFRGDASDVMKQATRRDVAAFLQPHIETVDPSDFNEAMMELGALVCTPRSPACDTCPLRRGCVALRDASIAALPVKGGRTAVPHLDVAVAFVSDSRGRVLLRCRPDGGMLAGMWELPGGKRKGEESLDKTVVRSVRERTGVEVEVGARCGKVEHAFSHFRMTLHVFRATRVGGRVRAGSRWVPQAEVADLPLPTANRKALELGQAGAPPGGACGATEGVDSVRGCCM
jgi:A/G-specific adenine glycosylase